MNRIECTIKKKKENVYVVYIIIICKEYYYYYYYYKNIQIKEMFILKHFKRVYEFHYIVVA